MSSASIWLLFLVLCWGLPSPHTTLSYAAVYYVTPHSPNPDCPSEEPCLTLNEYAQGSHFDGENNITLLFLNGEHNLTAQSLDFEHKALLKMAPVQTEVRIQLTNGTDIIVENVIEVEISGLSFVGVGQDCLSMSNIEHLSVSSMSIESCQLILKGELRAAITEFSATNSCICSISSQGNQTVAIKNGKFHFCTVSVTDSDDSLLDHIGDTVNNSLSVSLENSSMKSSNVEVRLHSPIDHELVIRNTSFTKEHSDTTKRTAISILIELSTAVTVKVNAFIENCDITGNYQGIVVEQLTRGVLYYSRYPNNQLTITNCQFINHKDAGIIFNTSGIVTITETVFLQNQNGMIADINHDIVVSVPVNITINIDHSIFRHNLGGIIMPLDCFLCNNEIIITMNLTDVTFQENSGVCLGVTKFQRQTHERKTDLHLNNVTFFNNSNIQLNTGIVQVDNSINLTIGDSCVFRYNQGTPIQAYSTTVSLSGMVTFENNVAFQGGAISLSQSMLRLVSVNHTNTSVIFANNTANSTGGAIYIDSSVSTDPFTGSSCFYGILGVKMKELKKYVITLHFFNNTAIDGGDDIYGATPNTHCLIHFQSYAGNFDGDCYFCKNIFQTDSSLSSISSDPKRVCLCDSSSQLMCANLSHIFYNTTRYPGEVFPLSLAVVGLDFGTVTGPVYAYLLNLLIISGEWRTCEANSGQNFSAQLYNKLTKLTRSYCFDSKQDRGH